MQKNTSSGVRKPSLPARVIRWTMFQIVSFVLAVLILGIGYAAVTWTNIPSGSGAAGQPVTQTLIQGIINNMNDLDSRVGTLMSNLTTLSNRVIAINPSGTTVSGSSVCIGGDCKTAWPSSTPTGIVVAGCSDAGGCWGGAVKNYSHTSTCPGGSTFRKLSGATSSSYEYSFICTKN